MSVRGPDPRSYRLSFQEDRHCSDFFAGGNSPYYAEKLETTFHCVLGLGDQTVTARVDPGMSLV